VIAPSAVTSSSPRGSSARTGSRADGDR
jgi:hypothetical protein